MTSRIWIFNEGTAAAAAKSLQSCPTLCDPIDGSPSGSPVSGTLQARTLEEWVAISFSNAWKWKVKVKSLSHVWLLATPWTAAYQAPPSMGFSRQEDGSGMPLPSPNEGTREGHYKEGNRDWVIRYRLLFFYILHGFQSQILYVLIKKFLFSASIWATAESMQFQQCTHHWLICLSATETFHCQ